MNYRFVSKVDAKLLEATKAQWLAQIERNPENTSATYYAAGLAYCAQTVEGTGFAEAKDGCLCAVVEGDNTYAAAFIVVSYAKARSSQAYLKMT